jgi:hypothetical protein
MARSRKSRIRSKFVPILIGVAALLTTGSPLSAQNTQPNARNTEVGAPLAAADAFLWTERYRSIEILEDAVKKNPKRTDYWVALLNALQIDSRKFIARCTARAALQANPNSPELIIARARVLEPAAAIDVLDELAKLSGHQQEAREIQERISLDAGVPAPNEQLASSVWAWQLIRHQQWQRAEEIVKRGLAANANDEALWACQATILAHKGEFSAALEAQKKGSAPGYIGEILLENEKPEMALESFTGFKPRGFNDSIDLIYAEALLQNSKFDEAEKVLSKWQGGFLAELLLVGHLVEDKKTDEAKARSAKLTRDLLPNGQLRLGSSHGPAVGSNCPKCLKAPLIAALELLLKEAPEKSDEIKATFGNPDLIAKPTEKPDVWIIQPASLHIRELQGKINNGTKGDQANTRSKLARILEEAERYDEAAAAYAPNAILPFEPSFVNRSPYDAVQWNVCKRRADAQDYFKCHSESISLVRSALFNIEGTVYYSAPRDGRKWLTSKEIAEVLIRIGPGSIASVIDSLHDGDPLKDRTPLVQVIEKVGSEHDIPVLLETLTSLAESNERPNGNDPIAAHRTVSNEALEAAVHHALEHLTDTKNTAVGQADRLKFWIAWWNDNARRVVSGAN